MYGMKVWEWKPHLDFFSPKTILKSCDDGLALQSYATVLLRAGIELSLSIASGSGEHCSNLKLTK